MNLHKQVVFVKVRVKQQSEGFDKNRLSTCHGHMVVGGWVWGLCSGPCSLLLWGWLVSPLPLVLLPFGHEGSPGVCTGWPLGCVTSGLQCPPGAVDSPGLQALSLSASGFERGVAPSLSNTFSDKDTHNKTRL